MRSAIETGWRCFFASSLVSTFLIVSAQSPQPQTYPQKTRTFHSADDFARIRSSASTALVDIPGAGHFDLVMPGTPAYATVLQAIQDALDIPVTDG